MAYLEGFNAADVEPNSRKPLPAGVYLCKIDETERKPSKSGNGDYLKVKASVIDGEYKGKVIFDQLNLWNANPVAKEIAWGTMSSICRAVNVMCPKDSNDLCGIPLNITVRVTQGNDGNAYNDVVSYDPRNISAVDNHAANNEKPSWM